MAKPCAPRVPFGPLDTMFVANDGDFADHLGVSRRAIVRWRQAGVTIDRAEQICDYFGVHPAEVWGAAWFETVVPA